MYSRLDQYPMLFSSEQLVAELVEQWHPGIGRAVLENWELAEPMCHAVNDQNDLDRQHDGPADLTDLLAVALLLARMFEGETIAVEIGAVPALARIGVDSAALVTIMRESQQEIAALSRALGR
jgi:HD-like signal output (HDOD) protein